MAIVSSPNVVQRPASQNGATAQTNTPGRTRVDEAIDRAGNVTKNVLHKYRTFNYRFTLAALPPKATNNNALIRQATEKFVIIKTTGKKVNELQGGNKAEGFNRTEKGSPGRFDLFMNNVDIETLMSFSQNTNMAMATKIQFDVYEPYSINGFMEALQVSAEAAGNKNYISSSYVLKVDFIGYTDDKAGDKIEEIGNSGTRYIVMFIKNVEVKMDESGTRYTVKAVARNEMGFSDLFALKESIQMSGSNVVEILTSLTNALNKSSANAALNEYKVENLHDTFEIVFPTFNPATGILDFNTVNPKFKEARLRDLTSDPSVFTFPPPGSVPSAYEATGTGAPRGPLRTPGGLPIVQPEEGVAVVVSVPGGGVRTEGTFSIPTPGAVNPQLQTYKYDPNSTSVMFTRGAKIVDIISSVIRDSDYARKIFQSNGNRIVDQFIEYFHVMIEMDEINEWNPYLNRPNYNFKFVVYPYKMHFTRIPLYQKLLTPAEQSRLTKHYIRRKYDYLYTGKNTDVRSFNLTFNHLYFQAYPRSMNNVEGAIANPDTPVREQRAGAIIQQQSGSGASTQVNPVPLSPKGPDDRRGSIVGPGGNATRPLIDSYDALVKNMHQAILDNTSMIKLDLEILGDPYFLVTGGLGNSRPKIIDSTITDNGEAPYFIHDVMILVEFRNPEDIDKSGLIRFDDARIPYNGCYRVSKVNSMFKDGVFTQKLQGVRIPGQPLVPENTATPAALAEGQLGNPFLTDVWIDSTAIAAVQA